MLADASSLHVSVAQCDDDIRAAQRLRYDVFVTELGGDGPLVDHTNRLERDVFDRFSDHLILRDDSRRNSPTRGIVGVYRLMTRRHAAAAGGFYSENEFDLSVLTNSTKSLLELGRSCLHPDLRSGSGLMTLWQGLARYVDANAIDLLFGVASFRGTDQARLQNALSHLHQSYLAAPDLRVTSRTPDAFIRLPDAQIDRKSAMRDTPALIKSYLKLGGVIGQGVFVDHPFNTTDVCMVLNTKRLSKDALSRQVRPRP
jgi:putative hemolysin